MEQTNQTTLSQSIKLDDLHEALLHTQELFERSLVPFMLFDETAKVMLAESPDITSLTEISCGVMRKYWTDSAKSIFRMWEPKAEITKVNVSFDHRGVPVVIWLIDGDYQFFRNPDVRFYCATEFYIPNPFRDYWKSKDYIK